MLAIQYWHMTDGRTGGHLATAPSALCIASCSKKTNP